MAAKNVRERKGGVMEASRMWHALPPQIAHPYTYYVLRDSAFSYTAEAANTFVLAKRI